jgi:hypothetical protein
MNHQFIIGWYLGQRTLARRQVFAVSKPERTMQA